MGIVAANVNPGFEYPEVLRKPLRNVQGSSTLVVDATDFPEEIQNLIILAAYKHPLPNCDALLYTPDNFDNWGRIAAGRVDNGETDVIRRAAEAHARVLQPPETLGFWTIGPGDQFDNKERIVIEAHLEQGHSFDFFAYSDVNPASLEKSIADGKKVAQELGLDISDENHIPMLGNVFTDKVRAQHKSKIQRTKGQKILATSFGFTFQNLRNPVSGYSEATASLTESLEKVRPWLPRDSRLFVTLDHQTDKSVISDSFEGPAHEDFFHTAVAHHLTEDIAKVTDLKRRFTSRTAILNREGVLRENVAFNIGDKGFFVVEAGSPIWNGISARLPAKDAVKAFDLAKWPSAFPDPINNPDRTLACHVGLKR